MAVALHLDICMLHNRDGKEMRCHKDYRSVLRAFSKNYPGLVCPNYAANELTALLVQSETLTFLDSQNMHKGFPELFALLHKRKWERIPEKWIPFLQQLAQSASRPQSCAQVPQLRMSSDLYRTCFLLCVHAD